MARSGFRWGVSIDNAWSFAGLPAPRSIIIPHVLGISLPSGPYNIQMDPERHRKARQIKGAKEVSDEEEESSRILCLNLAKELKASKIDFVRVWFQWNLFQKRIVKGRHEEQVFAFPLDNLVNSLHDEGIEIIAVIGNGYYRFLPQGINLDHPADYLARLEAASREIVRHYKGKIWMWQIENEPNWWLEHFASDWRRGGIWFERGIVDLILSTLKRIVNEEDPKVPTVVNLEADTAKVSSKSFAKYCDVLGLDFYPNYSHATPINVSEIKVASEAKRIAGKPAIVAETGYPSGPRFFGYSEEKQAIYVKKVCEEAYSTDGIEGLGIWRLSDTYWLSFPFQENHFGLFDMQGYPKPAWTEFKDQIKRLG